MNNQETFSDEDWLNTFVNRDRTRMTAETSLRTFDQFCRKQIGQDEKSKEIMIDRYKTWFEPPKLRDKEGDYYYPKSDIRSICLSLSKFIQFMGVKHDDMLVYSNHVTGKNVTFKAKNPRTQKLYFGYVKNPEIIHTNTDLVYDPEENSWGA